MATVDAMVAKAASQLGTVEVPVNKTPYGRWYKLDCNPWCDMFISWCGCASKNATVVGHFASTILHMAWFRAHGKLGNTPKRGALVFYNFGGRPRGVPEHVGIVEAVLPDGRIQTIEGNTSSGASGSQRNGGMVARRQRSTANVVGYGYPAYDEAARYRVLKTHGAHLLPSWASPARSDCKMAAGQVYPAAGGKSGNWVKVLVWTKSRKRVQAWAYLGKLKKL